MKNFSRRFAVLSIGLLLVSSLASTAPISINDEIFIPDVITQTFEVPLGIRVTPTLMTDLANKMVHRRITGLSFAGHTEITDAMLTPLKTVPLQELNLDGTSVTGAGLGAWKGSLAFKKLSANKSPLLNEGLEIIGTFKNLRTLSLKETRVDDEGLKSLTDLAQLRELDLSGTDVTGEGFATLQSLRQLKVLDLSNTSFQDKHLVHIRKITSLQKLYLGNTKITNSGMEKLRGLPQLHNLNVNCTGVTNEGLAPLSSNNELQTTNVCSE